MFPASKKSLIVVSEEKAKHHSALLRDLISAGGVKDAVVDVAVWTDVHYLANSPTLPSSQKIVFIGESKKTKSDIESLKNFDKKFDQFGIEIYSVGNRAAILVQDRSTTQDEYDSMIDFCTNNSHRIKEKILEKKEEAGFFQKALGFAKNNKATLAAGGIPAIAVGSIPAVIAVSGVSAVAAGSISAILAVEKIKSVRETKKIIEQKHNIGVQIFYHQFIDELFKDK